MFIAKDYTNITGWNEFTDYDVVPGVEYIYEVKCGGATTGPLSVTCNWVYKIVTGSQEVVFGAEGGVATVLVSLFKQTAAGSTQRR